MALFYPDLQEAKALAGDCRMIPVSLEVNADMETPISLFMRFEDSGSCFLLESIEGGEKWGRYSFIGRNPFLEVKSCGSRSTVRYRSGKVEAVEGNPVEFLKDLLEKYRSVNLPGLPRFNGGAVGYFGYDLVRHYENLPHIPEDDLRLPESYFLFMDEVLVYDHLRQKVHIIVNMPTEGNLERTYHSTVERIKGIYREILASRWKVQASYMPGGGKDTGGKENKGPCFISNMTREMYVDRVRKAKEYIRNGDIFQVVLSQRLAVETSEDPLNVYRVLRVINPSPYMYYLKFDEFKVVGSSPEMLLRVEDGLIETCPIAGTRKRGQTGEEDERLEQELLADEKELAEHMMLVDLARNDIGKVSEFGTVVVKELKHIHRFSHVMHIVTRVQGRLKTGKTPFDALMALLPAGTLSGAPKIRAMEIIDELESVKRGTYGGAIGYLGFNGNLDSCITIRTIVFREGKAYIQVGAGIVADSEPEREYEETLSKAGALLRALEMKP